MWDTREKVVLDLEVEPPEQPRQEAVVRTEIDSRLYFVNRPDATLGDQLVARDEGCLLDAVSQLKRRHHHEAEDHRPADVHGDDDPPREEEERDDEGPS